MSAFEDAAKFCMNEGFSNVFASLYGFKNLIIKQQLWFKVSAYRCLKSCYSVPIEARVPFHWEQGRIYKFPNMEPSQLMYTVGDVSNFRLEYEYVGVK